MHTIQLRPTTIADLDFVISAEQHPDNRPFVEPWTREQHTTALNNVDILHFVIEHSEHNHAVGYALLAGLKNPNQSIELRRIVVTEKGHGYGRTALHLITQLVFGTLEAHRLWLDVKEHNIRAQNIYKIAGFVVEGTLRECLKSEHGFESLIVMSMLKREWVVR